MQALLYVDARRSDRRQVNAPATLRDADDLPVDVIVDDLSIHGFRMITSQSLTPGQFIRIGIPGAGRHVARVARPTLNGFGCEFTCQLSPVDVLRAGVVDNVERGLFVSATPDEDFSEPEIQRWSRATRVAFVIGLAIVGWGLVFGLATLIG